MGDNEKKPQHGEAATDAATAARISVWAVPNDVVVRGTHTIAPSTRGSAGVLDDVSLQATCCNKADLSDLRWDPNFLPGAKDDEVDHLARRRAARGWRRTRSRCSPATR